jgi:hypothetical protein
MELDHPAHACSHLLHEAAMSTTLPAPRSTLGGVAVLMACSCGTAAGSAKLLALGGVGATTTLAHPFFFGVAAALVVYGLWHTARRSAYLALAAFAVLALAAALTPPRVMSSRAVPWNEVQMMGAGLYLVAVGLLAYAFWRAFPSPRPAASGTAMGGLALATGCNCCMAAGALAGMAVTSGGSPLFQSTPMIFWSALAVVAAGLYRLGGVRAAVWAPVGGLVVEFIPELIKLTGDWMVGGVNVRFFPEYMARITGSGLILYGFVVAYTLALARAQRLGEPSGRVTEAEAALAGA